jgi:hypothetical protein
MEFYTFNFTTILHAKFTRRAHCTSAMGQEITNSGLIPDVIAMPKLGFFKFDRATSEDTFEYIEVSGKVLSGWDS